MEIYRSRLTTNYVRHAQVAKCRAILGDDLSTACKVFVWNLIGLGSYIVKTSYDVNDELLKICNGNRKLDYERRRLMKYVEQANNSLTIITFAPKDFVLDFSLKFCKLAEKKSNSFNNALKKRIKEMGIKEVEAVTRIVHVLRVTEFFNAFIESKYQLLKDGSGSNIPTIVPLQVKPSFDNAYKSLQRICNMIDPYKHEDNGSNANILKTYESLIDYLMQGKNYNKSNDYAVGENEELLKMFKEIYPDALSDNSN